MNRVKISKLVNGISLIGAKVHPDTFKEGMDTLISLNPNIGHIWNMMVDAYKLSELFGIGWYDVIDIERFLLDFETELSELLDFFKTITPESFLLLDGLRNRRL